MPAKVTLTLLNHEVAKFPVPDAPVQVAVFVAGVISLPGHVVLRALGRRGFIQRQHTPLRFTETGFYPPTDSTRVQWDASAFERVL